MRCKAFCLFEGLASRRIICSIWLIGWIRRSSITGGCLAVGNSCERGGKEEGKRRRRKREERERRKVEGCVRCIFREIHDFYNRLS